MLGRRIYFACEEVYPLVIDVPWDLYYREVGFRGEGG